MASVDYLVVGAGFAGAVCAERLASAGKSVLVIDQRDHLGGNAYDYYNEDGILVHKYGPHIFHTNSAEVFDYLSQFTGWRPYEHRVLAQTSRGLVPVPINRTTLAAFGGDEAAARAEIIVPYTRKQWGCEPEDLDPSVLARVKTRDSDDVRYFTDRFQAMPRFGYLPLFERMLEASRITVALSTPYTPELGAEAAHVIWTGPLDQYFDDCYGRLPYRSARFEFHSHQPRHEYLQPAAVINVPDAAVRYTRVTECKWLTGQEHPKTVLCVEYPEAEGEPLWPIPTAANAALAQRYAALAKAHTSVSFLGRLGRYQYVNMDQCVAQALKLARTLIAQEVSV